MYAFIVKNEEGTWDIWNTLDMIPMPDREKRLADAVASGLPITGMDLTPYRETATSGAVWDGEKFEGIGNVHPVTRNPDADWDIVTQYGYICDNTLLIIFYSQVGSIQDDKYKAIFDGETSIIRVPDDEDVKVGDIWDGTQVISV